MTLPTNDDFANCELSIEELDAIAAGGFWSDLKKVGDGVLTVGGWLLQGTAYFAAACAVLSFGAAVVSGKSGGGQSNQLRMN